MPFFASMTVEKFKIRYPEFEDIEADKISLMIEESKLFVSEKAFNAKAELAIFLLVAHEITLEKDLKAKGNTDKIISRSIEGGSATLAYAPAKNLNEAYYQKTPYGEKYLSIKKTVRFVGAVLT